MSARTLMIAAGHGHAAVMALRNGLDLMPFRHDAYKMPIIVLHRPNARRAD